MRSSAYTYQLNDVFRRHATGNFKALTTEVGQAPSMLRYLDNVQSTKKRPNENWARELMELFTMGQGHYTEQDIKESARAFTGWSVGDGGFAFREENHDFAPKVFMGRHGDFDGWDILNIIFAQPATAEFICAKLWTFFAYEEPEEALVNDLADTMRASGYELKPVLSRMFQAQAFYSEKAIGTQIKSPTQFVLQLASDLGMSSPPYFQMTRATAQLGQNLLYPPNVKGWDGNRAWINANSLLVRYNLPGALVAAKTGKDRRTMTEQEKLDSRQPAMAAMQEHGHAGKEDEAWNPRALFASLTFDTAGGCVEALERHFLSVPLGAAQRHVLVQALGAAGPETPLRPRDVTPPGVRAALHLLLSTAEYQLC